MNLKIAICDDEASICDLYREKVSDFIQRQGMTAKITTFHDPVALLNMLYEEKFDLVLLDIDMVRMFITNLKFILQIRLKAHIFPHTFADLLPLGYDHNTKF